MEFLFKIYKVMGYQRGTKNLLFFGGFGKHSGLGLQIFNVVFWAQVKK